MELCAEAVKISPNSPVAQYNFGMALLQNQRLGEALHILTPPGGSLLTIPKYNTTLAWSCCCTTNRMKPRVISPPLSLKGRTSRRRIAAWRRLCPNNTNPRKPFFITARRCASSRNSPKQKPRSAKSFPPIRI